MDIFKRELAPITDTAWELIRGEASTRLRANLSARKIAHVVGPKDLTVAAVPLGRLEVPAEQPLPGVRFGVHRVLPLVELRAPFELDIWELDNADRGAKDIDFDPLRHAAKCITAVEERAVYQGLQAAGIVGMMRAAEHEPIELGNDAGTYADAVARAILTLQDSEVHGPYALVLGPRHYRLLAGTTAPYPPRKQIEHLLEGPVILSPHVEGDFLIATEAQGLELTVGQDYAIGYESHSTTKVRLYITVSFTFRVVDGTVYVPFKTAG